MKRLYYDINDSLDGGYYGEIYDQYNISIDETDRLPTSKAVKLEVQKQYPTAKLVNG